MLFKYDGELHNRCDNHPITIGNESLMWDGEVARAKIAQEQVGWLRGYPVLRNTSDIRVVGLPDQQDGIYYIVSNLVAQVLPERPDIFAPNTVSGASNGKIRRVSSLLSYYNGYDGIIVD